MKFTVLLLAASCAAAMPLGPTNTTNITKTTNANGFSSGGDSIGLTGNEFLKSNGTCRDVTLLYARGSIQPGNLVRSSTFPLILLFFSHNKRE